MTGASGLLGSQVVLKAREHGCEVTGLYHKHPGHVEGVSWRAADFSDPEEVDQVFREVRPSCVVHCAAATNVDWCEEHPEEAYRINVGASQAIAEHASRTGARLLHISTDAVFDGEGGNYSETDTPSPVNIYAQTKLRAEEEVQRNNPEAAIARVNLYGWNPGWSRDRKPSLAEWMVQLLAAGKPVPGFSDVRFCPMLAQHLAEILLALLGREVRGIYHVVGAESISKFEFGRRIAETFGFDRRQVVETSVADARFKARRPRDTSLNTGKICSALKRPMPDVETGLRRFAELRELAGRTS